MSHSDDETIAEINDESVVAGRAITRSLVDLHRAATACIVEENAKPLPDNAVIGVLCDTVRLIREYIDSLLALGVFNEAHDQPAEEPTND